MQRDAPLPQGLLLVDDFVIVRWGCDIPAAELSSGRDNRAQWSHMPKTIKTLGSELDWRFRVLVQTERQACVQSLVGLPVPPRLNGWSVWGGDVRGTHFIFSLSEVEFPATGFEFHFLHRSTESWDESHPAVGLRKPEVHVIDCGTDVGVPFSACSRWCFWFTVAPHHGQIKKSAHSLY